MPKWVIVEDEPDLLDTLLAMFEIWGIDGLSFSAGHDAFNWIYAVDTGQYVDPLPQLALIDLRLPDAFGVDVAIRIRQSPVLHNMTIVLMTAYQLSQEHEHQFVQDVEADAFFHKPLPGMKELQKRLNTLVAQRSE